ncbi:MAG: cyclic nucleotide-binding domain-containing protein, partial [Alphaproteobacteria bacterium]|nr:cyclic nucleotide-binding domain-containing protein [Alphaproteobacteria bacterium]
MNAEDKELIKTLTPFSGVSESDLNSALGQAKIVEYTKGKMIFKRAEQDDQVYWLLSGAVDLLDENFEAKSRKAGEVVTKSPLDHNSPHRLTAVTTEDTRVLICPGPTIAILMGEGGDASVAE